ncbi:MAG: Gfo/Idh/MocA family oxidoreductase [Simkaniaceae bacterium]|nr:Gfo/Idh/MocA family oxidoreductase [Simkaniaceae bacterium]
MSRILVFIFSIACLFSNETIDVAIFGLGGRAQDVLVECLKIRETTQKDVRVVAVCDNKAKDSYNFYINNRLLLKKNIDVEGFKAMFQGVKVYPDSKEGINQLLANHPNVDQIFVTSANYRHNDHLKAALAHSKCKKYYIEKPIFKTLDDYSSSQFERSDAEMLVGLPLRYSHMTRIATAELKKYKNALGRLRQVRSKEHVNFAHGLTIIMMNWRRYQSWSGGLLLEKSVHDLDLALHFMAAVDEIPQSLEIMTTFGHEFYKKSNKKKILNRLLSDETLRKGTERWDRVAWERAVNFSYDKEGKIDWPSTMDAFFEEFPADDDFTNSDIIPDHSTLSALIETEDRNRIDFALDVKLDRFSQSTDRGTHFDFEYGEVIIDIERRGKMYVMLEGEDTIEIELTGATTSHAGGDTYVAHAILGTLPEGQHFATFNDPSVQLSTVMGLVSEYQVSNNSQERIRLEREGAHWSVKPPELNIKLNPQFKESPRDAENSYLILDGRPRVGVFGAFTEVLGLVKHYDSGLCRGVEVDFAEKGKYYDNDYGPNWWNYYCENIKIGEKTQVIHFDHEPPGVTPWYTEKYTTRPQAHRLINKYIHFKPHLKQKVAKLQEELFENKYVIGVHYRGTDKILGLSQQAPFVSYETVREEIEKKLATLEGRAVKIFIVTDEEEFIRYMRDFCGDKICYYPQEVLDHSTNEFEQGKDAIINCLLLSKTDYLIRMSSNLSLWSTYFNPNLEVKELSQRNPDYSGYGES